MRTRERGEHKSNSVIGLDGSTGMEGESLKQADEQPAPEEKKRRLDVAA